MNLNSKGDPEQWRKKTLRLKHEREKNQTCLLLLSRSTQSRDKDLTPIFVFGNNANSSALLWEYNEILLVCLIRKEYRNGEENNTGFAPLTTHSLLMNFSLDSERFLSTSCSTRSTIVARSFPNSIFVTSACTSCVS
jgi:hypothetical protein